jgi:hypothetical protein
VSKSVSSHLMKQSLNEKNGMVNDMFNLKNIVFFVIGGFFGFGGMVHAATTTTYQFGSLLSGSDVPAYFYFADLTTVDYGNDNWSFTLNTLPAFTDTFGSSAFLGSMAVDRAISGSLPDTGNVSGGGVSSVGVSPGGGPEGSFDFSYTFGLGADKLMGNESVSWTSSGLPSGTFTNGQLALRVQGIGPSDASAWYVSPVPEPETYAILLAGLGLLGFVTARRCRRTEAV